MDGELRELERLAQREGTWGSWKTLLVARARASGGLPLLSPGEREACAVAWTHAQRPLERDPRKAPQPFDVVAPRWPGIRHEARLVVDSVDSRRGRMVLWRWITPWSPVPTNSPPTSWPFLCGPWRLTGRGRKVVGAAWSIGDAMLRGTNGDAFGRCSVHGWTAWTRTEKAIVLWAEPGPAVDMVAAFEAVLDELGPQPYPRSEAP